MEEKYPEPRRVVNIINFVRGCEPRCPSADLFTPVQEEILLCRKHGFPNTFLLQYDAMLRPDFRSLFARERDDNMELGIWIEIVRPLAEAVGIRWRGRPGYDWDWYVNPGFLMAYTQKQRRLLIDEQMRLFKETFGCWPRSAGSWLLDAWSMQYMTETYHVEAFAVCREQYSVDAYTLWGGYYNQGYFPSKKNMLCPAQSARCSAPVFRMLGIDPVFGYDAKGFRSPYGSCNTLEPAWDSGADPKCVDWYFHTYFENECLNFAYVQIGQENSFGWPKFGAALTMQMDKLDALRQKGTVSVEKLCETGAWFSSRFARTPATSLIAESDWAHRGYASCWYDCRRYRANLFLRRNHAFFRDIFLFDEKFPEEYYTKPCRTWNAVYENLPVMDSYSWSRPGRPAELGLSLPVKEISYRRCGENTLAALLSGPGGTAEILFEEARITVAMPQNCRLSYRRAQDGGTPMTADDRSLSFTHRGYSYRVAVEGIVTPTPSGCEISPKDGLVRLVFGQKARNGK